MSNPQDEDTNELPLLTFTLNETPKNIESKSGYLTLPEFNETEKAQINQTLKKVDDYITSSNIPSYTSDPTPADNYMPMDFNPEEYLEHQKAQKQAYAWSNLQKKYPKHYLIQLANMNKVIMERVLMYGFDN